MEIEEQGDLTEERTANGADGTTADGTTDGGTADGRTADGDVPATGAEPEGEPGIRADEGEFVSEQLFVVHAEEDGGRAKLKAVLEAVIYITEEPLSVLQIANALQQPPAVVKELLEELTQDYAGEDRGLAVREIAGGFKMATKPEHHEAVRAFVRNLKPPLKLSLAALETLAVIAYKQPITGPEILEIRGVQGTGVLKTLLDRKLIAAAGRKQVVGKPILYKTTKEFLMQFGLRDLAELPTLKEFEEIGRMALSEDGAGEGPPIGDPETEQRPVEEPEHPNDPGPAEDPQEQPVEGAPSV